MPAWLSIEHLSCQGTSLPALIDSPVKIKKHLYESNPIVNNSMKIWKQVVTALNAPRVYLDSPICYNHAFKPALDDVVFSKWREKGNPHSQKYLY